MKELIEKRAKAFEQGRALLLAAEKEARALTSDEQTQYDRVMADVKALGETIERSRQSAVIDAELSRSIGPVAALPEARNTGSDIADTAMDGFIRSGVSSLTTEQRNLFGTAPGYRDAIQLRAASPLSAVTPAAGAYVIPQGFVANLERAMKWFGGMRQSARIIRTATGQPLPWPTFSDVTNVGELVAENTAVSQASTEMSFGVLTLKANKYSSKLVLVPIELIQDSAFDVQSFVAEALGTRLGRIQNTHFTTGTGTNQPNGVVTAATSALTTASPTAVVYSELVGLLHKIDPAYRVGAQWMFNDSTAAALESLTDSAGRPLLNSSLSGISASVNAGDANSPARATLLGYPVVINNDVDSIAATKKPILFGDFSKYVIRDVMDVMLVRFGETYMASGQIGFVAFVRTDGNLVDAGMHPIQYMTCHV